MKHPWSAAIAGLFAALMLTGCAGIPSSGPVVRVEAPASRTHSTVRYEPARPRAGATPLRIVEGYLDAMLAYPEATGIVQEFMTPSAIRGWDSAAGLNVYASAVPTLRAVAGNRAQVSVRLRSALTFDASGRASRGPSVTTRILELERVGGQWRVDSPVPGYLISQSFASDYVHTYPLWFFDETGQRLVPEVVHAVVSDQLPLTLLHRLADGPRSSARRTFVPDTGRLRARIVGNLLEVDIERKLDANEDKIAAQLLSTLRGVPGLDGIRILLNGVQDRRVDFEDAVIGFGPGSQPSLAYAVRNDKVVVLGSTVKAMPGPWGKSARGAVEVAVGRSSVAAVLPGHTAVVVGARSGGGDQEFAGIGFVRPEWDDAGLLWLVDNPAGAARVRVIAGAGTIDLEASGLGVVESFAVSPDGSRYAATVVAGDDARVLVGDIEHDVDGIPRRLGAPLLVSRGLVGESQIGWASQTQVEFIAGPRSTAQLHTVGIDGTDVSAGLGAVALPGGVAAWAGPAGGAVRWALDRRGRLWRQADGSSWKQVPVGTAGGPITGLSTAH